MSFLVEYTENVIWPRYKDAVEALGKLSWQLARKGNKALEGLEEVPLWFQEILDAQAKALLNLAFRSPQDWLILPEPIEGFAMVIYKTPKKAGRMVPTEVPQLKHHTFDQFSELARVAERTIVKIIRWHMKSNDGDLVELSNEDAIVYVFPKGKMEEYLRKLGFPEDAIPKLLTIEDIETDFFPDKK